MRTLEGLKDQLGDRVEDWTWDRVIALQHRHPLEGRVPLAGRLSTTPVKLPSQAASVSRALRAVS